MTEFIAWLRRQIDEDEMLAVAASQTREPGTSTGEHWRWECQSCDVEIIPNVGVDEYLTCPHCGLPGGSLRSVEQYETGSVGSLPAFITNGDEALTVVGAYLLRCEPARMLREVAAKRRLIEQAERDLADDSAHEKATWTVRTLADVYRGRPGWRDEGAAADFARDHYRRKHQRPAGAGVN